MKKFTIASFIITASVFLTACGSSPASLTAAEMFEIVSSEGLCPSLDTQAVFGSEEFERICPAMFGTDISALSDGGIMYTASGQTADEIAILSREGDLKAVLSSHAESRAAAFEGYAPAEQQKAKNALIFDCGDMTVLVIADNAEKIRDRLCEE